MTYTYKGKRPIAIAESFIDSYINRVPAVKLPPERRFTYHQGVFLSGVEKIYLQNKKSEYDRYIKDYLNIVLDENKRARRIEGDFWISLNSLDFRMPGILLARLYEESGDVRYLESIGELCESLLSDFPKNSHGGFWHMKSQPNQMWLDGLYMAGPLCAKYCVLSGKKEFGEAALKQMCLMYEHMRDKENNLLYHGWDDSFSAEWADKETGLSAEKWGRAMGWFAVAAVDIIEILGTLFEGAEIACEYIKEIFKALAEVQGESGYWYQVIDKPNAFGNWEESSGTCLVAYSMAKAVRLGMIEKEYIFSAKKAYEAVIDSLKTRDNGEIVLEKICIGTCIESGTYEHYINRDTIENDLHGGGAFLLMCAEMNQAEG